MAHMGTLAIMAMATLAAIAASPAKADCGLGGAARARPTALALAAGGNLPAGLATAGRDSYLRGLVRQLGGDHGGAVAEFEDYADSASRLAGWRRPAAEARAAYWAARALRDEGAADASRAAMAAAAGFRGTFYGQMADGPGATASDWPRPGYLYVDPRTPRALVWAVIRIESAFDPRSTSSANALGLMQVIPSTGWEVAHEVGGRFDRRRMLRDAHYNVAIGSTYLGEMLDLYHGYLPLALAAYNAGPGCAAAWVSQIGDPRTEVDALTWLEAIPLDETRDYIQSVLAAYASYAGSR